MTPERWQQVKDVLAAALDLPADQRAPYLDRSCAGDPSLRKEVELLLDNEKEVSPRFLGSEALAETAAAILPDEKNPWIGRLVGVYRIVEQIGSGGMGEVYRAVRDDDQFRKEVALKVIPSGHESGFVISRFRNERQILASLDHPNIARLLDGGTTDEGVPYFVMELIDGQLITDYCDQHSLSITERLRLFSSVCAAVHYAHQRLIIHRDIKPGNILVTADGTPKLLDFGISKILGYDAGAGTPDATLTAFRAFTPRYASPEQINAEPMTTASDVYSLGMVLYELLTGRSPYRLATGTPQEMSDAACKTEPQKPSVAIDRSEPANQTSRVPSLDRLSSSRKSSPEKLRKRLSGDLDNIVLMALRKEPSRRYASVEQFEEDISRHLRNIPVVARNDTAWYRSSKFIRRHRAGAIASALVALALTAGAAVALYEAHVARQQAEIARMQRARAERRFNDVRKLANSLMFEVHDSIKDLPGATPARKLLVNRALEYLDSLSQEASGDASLQRELAAAYDRVGDLLGYNGAANLGDYSGALQSLNKALAIRESAAASNPDDLQIQLDLLSDYFRLSFVLNDAGNFEAALDDLRKAVPLTQHVVAEHPESRYRDWLAGIYWQTGNIQFQMGKYNDALSSYRQATSIREPMAKDSNAEPLLRSHLAADYIGLGKALSATGDLNQAMQASAQGVQILEQLTRSTPNNATLQEYLGEAYGMYANSQRQHKDYDQALDTYAKARNVFGGLANSDPTDSLAVDNLALISLDAANVFMEQGKTSSAIPLLRTSIAHFEKVEHKNHNQIQALAGSYGMLGKAYSLNAEREQPVGRKIADLREAQSWYTKSLRVWRQEPTRLSTSPTGDDYTEDFVVGQLANCEAALARLGAR